MRVPFVELSYLEVKKALKQLNFNSYKVIKIDGNLRSSLMKARTGLILKALRMITVNDDKKLLKNTNFLNV